MNAYSGDSVQIEELPSGCILSGKHGEVLIATTQDALAVIASLVKMLKIMDEKDII